MQPQATAQSNGQATPGTIIAGPFEGPLVFNESGIADLVLTRAVTLKDAIAQLPTGGTPAQGHGYLLCKDDLSRIIATLYAGQLQPGSANRSVPQVSFPAGSRLLVKAVQLSGSSAEATVLVLRWA